MISKGTYLGGADTLAWIIDDSYKDGKKENGTRYLGINVNLSNRDNHFSSKKKKNSPTVVNTSLKGKHSEPKSLGQQSMRHIYVLRTIANNGQLLTSYEHIRSKANNLKIDRKKNLYF